MVQAQYPDLDTLRQRHTNGDRPAPCLPRWTQVRARAPTGTLCAKEGSRFPREPASQPLASRNQARSLLPSTDRSAPTSEPTDSG